MRPLLAGLLFSAAVALASCGQTTTTVEAPPAEVAASEEPAPAHAPMYLDDALRAGVISARVAGNGSSSGASIVARITGLGSTPVSIRLREGTVLRNGNSSGQSMVAAGFVYYRDPSSGAEIEGNEVRVYPGMQTFAVAEAYCLDLHLDNPSESDSFSTGAGLDSRSALVIEEGHARNAGLEVIQTAIWLDRSPPGREAEEEAYIQEVFLNHNSTAMSQAWALLNDLAAAGRMQSRSQAYPPATTP